MEFIDFPTPVQTDGRRTLALASLVQHIPTGERLGVLLHSTADYLKTLTKSDGFVLYSFDETLRELYICPHGKSQTECFISRYKWKIDHGETIATYAFKKMTPILVDANTSVDLNFPYLQALPTLYPRFILSIPLVNFQKRCFGVVEYYRNEGKQFSELDVQLCQFLLQNCAEAYKQNENAVFSSKYNEIQSELQRHLERFAFTESERGSYSFLQNVVTMARDYTGAVSSCMFFRKNNDNVKIVYTDENVNLLPPKLGGLGPITRSVIEATFSSTLLNRSTHGILKVRNKMGVPHFSNIDKQILEAFSKMCSLWCRIEYMSGYIKKQLTLNENLLNLINVQLQNADNVGNKLEVVTSFNLDELYSWSYRPSSHVGMKEILCDAVKMITRLKGQLPIGDELIRNFVVMIAECHLRTGKHDFRHTVLCMQGLFKLLANCNVKTTEYEAFPLIIVSLCHSIRMKNKPTATSSIFGRYNLFPNELTRFEIVQFIIREVKLLDGLNPENQQVILQNIKGFMVDLNLARFKHNVLEFSKLACNTSCSMQQLQDPKFQSLVHSILPGIGHLLRVFKSEMFSKIFPHFNFIQYLEQNNPTACELIHFLSPFSSINF